MFGLVRKIYNRLVISRNWSLMYKKTYDSEYVDISQPKDVARADCFIVECGDKNYIFFEEFIIQKNRKGYLAVGELDNKTNSMINIKKILELNHHLSYPFVFNYNDKWYMIPETHCTNSIDLYYFSNFPYEPVKVRTLISDINAVDSTLLIKDNIFYIFTNVKNDKISHNNSLCIYYSDDILNGNFLAHPKNPIRTDFKYSRMAGAIMCKDKVYYRFAQDCSVDYGLKIYKILIKKIDTKEYEEEVIEQLQRPKKCIAMHTFASNEKYDVIDVVKANYSLKNIMSNFLKLVKNQLGSKICKK